VSWTGRTREELEFLLFGLIDCATRTNLLNLFPDLNASVCWRSNDGIVYSAVPLADSPSTEDDAVRYVAQTFFQMVTAIKLENSSSAPPLSQWCRGAAGQLSRVVEACLNSERGKRTITTFAQLNTELGRPQSSMVNGTGWVDGMAQSNKVTSAVGLGKVGGMHELKSLLLAEVVEPIRNPEPYKRYGLSIPNGILLYGPPGCGKTYIARALAEELGHHFLEIVPSELASPYVHGSVIRIRELFDEAAENAPAVVFIDEFEALVPARSGLGGFQHHKAEEVNEILTHLNASSEKRVFVIAATNQPEMIDPAVRRTGRLDKLIYVGPPDAEARRDMLLLHLSQRPLSDGFDAGQLAEKLQGYSASDIRFLVDEAARDALLRGVPISLDSFSRAMAGITPSIPSEIELQYQSIAQRGL
jgi:ATPase family associated with various cellular activities (AAA)